MNRFPSNCVSVSLDSHPYSIENAVAGLINWLHGQDSGARLIAMSVPADEVEQDSQQLVATIKEAQSGSGSAFSKLVELYQQRIGIQMRRFTRDHLTCEELTHDVFVEAYMGLGSFKFNAPFLHWLRRIAVRVGYRHWKVEKRGSRIGSIEESQSHEFAPARMDQSTSASDAAEYVHWLLSQLSPPDRLVLTVIYLDSCSIKEAAFRCGWTVTGTKLRLFRARKKMITIMERCES